MPLKITLKPRERLILGGAVLRERDILSERNADSPCRRIYFAIQLMYVDERNLPEHHRLYWMLMRDLLAAAPSTARLADEINGLVLERKYYPALKVARQLI